MQLENSPSQLELLIRMFCGLILYDNDWGLLQTFVHIKYYMFWYFTVTKYVFEIDKGQQF